MPLRLNARERKNAGDTEKLQGSTMGTGMGGKGTGSKPISVSVQLSKPSSEGTTEKDSEYSLSYYTYESEPKRSIDDTATTTSDITLAPPPPPPKRRSQMPTSYRNDVPARSHSRFRPRSRSTLSRRSHKAPTEVAYSDKSEVLGGVVSQSFDSATTFDTLAMMPAQFPPVPPPPPVLQSPVRAKLLAPSATITKAQWAKTSTRWASEDDDESDDARAQRPTRTRHRGGAQSHDLRLNIPPSQPEAASSRIHVRAASHLDLVSPIDPAPSPAPSFGFAAAMFTPSPSPMSATGSRRPLPQHVPQASTSRAAPMSTPAHLDPRVRELITSRQNL
ncbi:hypothetical protein C8F01DRAFT_320307 [Mycena amicta]|nr:hypothetical protein C8F01DRAFT_320307 [Mycena amicta]